MMTEEPIQRSRLSSSDLWERVRWPLTACLGVALVAALLVSYGKRDHGEVRLSAAQLEEVTHRQGFLADGRIDLNSASYELLLTLPGIGEARAGALVAARSSGRFSSIEDVVSRTAIPLSLLTSLTDLAGLR
jgi:DNA uptake protein ComE-like DNA-binding protein